MSTLKRGIATTPRVNPQNLRPVFTQEQLALSLRATYYSEPILRAVGLMDIGKLHQDILSAQKSDKHCSDILSQFSDTHEHKSNLRWSINDQSLLRYDHRIWVLDSDDLRLQILLNSHDHPISGHYGQNKTLVLVQRNYTWPSV